MRALRQCLTRNQGIEKIQKILQTEMIHLLTCTEALHGAATVVGVGTASTTEFPNCQTFLTTHLLSFSKYLFTLHFFAMLVAF